MRVYTLADSPLFAFNGKHCHDMQVTFRAREYPFAPRQNVPGVTIAARHGTIRYPGRTFGPTTFSGTLYWMTSDGATSPITTREMLMRASDIAAWLCGNDGRGQLVLDALDDRFYIAELADGGASLSDADWLSGEASITFVCQPFARSIVETTVTDHTQAQSARKATMIMDGNVATPLAFRVTNKTDSVMQVVVIEAPDTVFEFDGLGLARDEALHGYYDDNDILRLEIEGVDGALRSATMARKPQSDDDLMLYPGANEITIKTQTACDVTLEARGRWM